MFNHHRLEVRRDLNNSPQNPRGTLYEALAIEFAIALLATGIAYVLGQSWVYIFGALHVCHFRTAFRLHAFYSHKQ